MKKRILFVDHDRDISGATVSMGYIIRKFIECGFDVFVLTPKNKKNEMYLKELGAQVLTFSSRYMKDFALDLHFTSVFSISFKSFVTIAKNIGKFIIGFIVSLKAIREIRPDLVYINEYVVIQASLASKFLKVPAAIHIRSMFLSGIFGIRRFLISRAIVKFNDFIAAISPEEKAQLYQSDEMKSKTLVIGEFLGKGDFTGKFDIQSVREKYKLPQDRKIVLFLGGIAPIKGTLEFLQAAELTLNKDRNLIFLVAGRAFRNSAGDLKYYNACLNIADKYNGLIRILDHVDNPGELISCSYAVVSLNTVSHFSRPVIEAWAGKKPVICFSCRHADFLINDGINGLLIPKGDAGGLSEAILKLADNEQFASCLAQKGYEKALNEYDSEKNLALIFEKCNELIRYE